MKANPNHLEARLRLGQLLGQRGRPNEALVELRAAAGGVDDRLLAYYAALLIAREEAGLNNVDAARASYQRAATLYPRAQAPQVGLSELEMRAGNRSGAAQALEVVWEWGGTRRPEDDPWSVPRVRRRTGRWSSPRGNSRSISSAWCQAMRIACLTVPTIGIGVLLSAATAASQQPTFRARIESVRVDVLVTENRRVVRGLQASDFELTDNGVLQQIDLVAFEQLPLNVVMAFDMSESMTGQRLTHLRQSAQAVLAGLVNNDRAALLTFNDRLQRPYPLTRDLHRVRAALDELAPEGPTALIDGTYAGLTLAGADAGRDLLLVFSDGVDTVSFLPPSRVLEAALRTDVTVYGVRAQGARRGEFLEELSAATGGRTVEIASTTDLQKTFVAILDEFRQRYVVSFTPRGVSSTGWHRLQVRVKGRRPTITARQGYTAGSER